MPIVDIEIVAGTIDARATQDLADGIGRAFEAEPGKVWLRVRELSGKHYAENDTAALHPVFVSVIASAPPEGATLKTRINQIVDVVARHTGRPRENIHVEFAPAARGRIAFGGKLVE